MADSLTMDFMPAVNAFVSRMRAYDALLRAQLDITVRAQTEVVGQRMDATTPVDTGKLRANRSAVTQRGPLTYSTGYSLPYAPVLEYGGYHGVGPKTVALGGGALGADFVAGPGIYAKQAPLGWVRRALAAQRAPFAARVLQVVRQSWEGGTGMGQPTPRALNLSTSDLGNLFGIAMDEG